MPQAFRLEGYFVARIGKLYHYNVPKSVGTNGHDDPGSWELELNPAGCDRLIEEPDFVGDSFSRYASPRGDLLHTDGMQATDAEWVLERCARDTSRPFLLALGFFRPHTPYVAPQEYFEGYPLEQMPLVEGVEEDQKDLPAPALAGLKKGRELSTDRLRREAKQAYFASITFMDAQVGRVLDALDRLGLTDNTIIVFTSDHGYHLGEHGLWKKMSLFEESARVPLIIAAPGMQKAGSVVETPVGLIDLYPTLADLCGVEAPDNVQGQNLAPILEDPSLPGRGYTISQVTRKVKVDEKNVTVFGYTIRTPRWRYTSWDEGRHGHELYDHENDPLEQTNLAGDAAYGERVAELSHKLAAAVAATFPASGQIPPINSGLWAPNLTAP